MPFDYDADALEPVRWLEFLDELWPDDADSIAALQEFFGYVISGRFDLQKILLLVGPTRGGKGAIARVLGQLVGPENVAGPTLSRSATTSGWRRCSASRSPSSPTPASTAATRATVVERLLAISGEDTITVNRKYRDQWTGKLPSRFMVISNELPHFGDAAGAIVGRFVVLLLTHSWLGERGPRPRTALCTPSCPRSSTGRSTASTGSASRAGSPSRPSSDEAIIALIDLASPVAAFVRDRCARGLDAEVPVRRAVHGVEGVGRGQRPQARHRSATLRPRPARRHPRPTRRAHPRRRRPRTGLPRRHSHWDPQCVGPRTFADLTRSGPQRSARSAAIVGCSRERASGG